MKTFLELKKKWEQYYKCVVVATGTCKNCGSTISEYDEETHFCEHCFYDYMEAIEHHSNSRADLWHG